MTDDILNDDAAEGKKKRRLGRRRKKDKKPDDMAEKAPKAADDDGDSSSPLAGIRQWLVDSYNGIFKIVIEPQLPSWRVMGFMILAFLFGMFWAYNLNPVQFYDGAPHQMRDEFQDVYVIGVAASALSDVYGDEAVATLLDRVDDPAQRVQDIQAANQGRQIEVAMQEIADIAQDVDGQDAPSGGSLFGTIFQILLAIILFIAISWIIALAWGLLIGGYYDRARLAIKRRIVGESEDDIAARKTMAAERRRRDLQKQMDEDAKQAAASDLGPPVVSKPSIYFKGRAYDDSFAIEDANDMFLGEMGATIAKSIGDDQDLAAVELWLFDKDDFVKTYTKVFVSEHGYNDPVTMSDLETRVDDASTDIVVLKQGAEHTLESNNLIIKAKVVEIEPGTDSSLPPNSHFEGLTIQMQAFQKSGDTVPTPAAAPSAASGGLPDVSQYEIGPPPTMPGSSSTPPAPPPPASSGGLPDVSEYEIGPPPEGAKPLTPPPMDQQPPSNLPPIDDDDEDDPFGGTGDFTPVGR
jgi:hypothetical protein